MFNTIKVNNTDTNYTHSIFDISDYNSGATYTDLSAALAAIPESKLHGGMTVCYKTDDNKYLQYRLMSDTFSITESDWQGIDEEPTVYSKNLIESGGVADKFKPYDEHVEFSTIHDFDSTIEIQNDNDENIIKITDEGVEISNLKLGEEQKDVSGIIKELEVDKACEVQSIAITKDNNEKILSIDDFGFKVGDAYVKDVLLTGKNNSSKHIGGVDYEPLPLDGYASIIMYGQSLSTGDVSLVPVSGEVTSIVSGTFMLGYNVCDAAGQALNPLKASVYTGWSLDSTTAESPVVNAVYSLKKQLDKTQYRNLDIIASSFGKGATTIEDLSKGGTIYQDRFLRGITKIKQLQNNVVCPAIVFMQGEYNQRVSDTTTVAEYKQLVTTLKNDMQSDIMTIYGQSNRPLFFVYQPSLLYTPKFPIVAEALRQFAEENDDVIMMSAHYMCPTSGGGHLTSNGYRWYGEYIAKAIYKALIESNEYNSIIVDKITRYENRVVINLNVPVEPLVVDNGMVAAQKDYGFALYKNDVKQYIDAKLVSNNTIVLYHQNISLSDTLELEYAGKATNGRGNIRDSDEWIGFGEFLNPNDIYTSAPSSIRQTMIDNEEAKTYNGEHLYIKKYTCFNWMNTFRVEI